MDCNIEHLGDDSNERFLNNVAKIKSFCDECIPGSEYNEINDVEQHDDSIYSSYIPKERLIQSGELVYIHVISEGGPSYIQIGWAKNIPEFDHWNYEEWTDYLFEDYYYEIMSFIHFDSKENAVSTAKKIADIFELEP